MMTRTCSDFSRSPPRTRVLRCDTDSPYPNATAEPCPALIRYLSLGLLQEELAAGGSCCLGQTADHVAPAEKRACVLGAERVGRELPLEDLHAPGAQEPVLERA